MYKRTFRWKYIISVVEKSEIALNFEKWRDYFLSLVLTSITMATRSKA
jgi:hypothetical protein